MTEDAKVSIRNIRQDFKKKLDQAKADKTSSEDVLKGYETDLQKAIDAAIKSIDEIEKHKEAEIMKV